MSFEKKDWKYGDTITAEELNRLENGVQEALECCGDKGFECTEEYTLLTDESVTTAASEGGSNEGNLAYSTLITADTIKVTFNGVEYTCQRLTALENFSAYGAPSATEGYDFSEFPFCLDSNGFENNNYFCTETAGTYQVKIEALEGSVETSECFEKAVNKVRGVGTFIIGVDHTEGTFPNVNTIFDKTWKEVNDALARGERVVVVSSSSGPFDSANQTVILNTMGNSTFVAFGISANGGAVTPMNYYACSKDGYLQTQECQQETPST